MNLVEPIVYDNIMMFLSKPIQLYKVAKCSPVVNIVPKGDFGFI